MIRTPRAHPPGAVALRPTLPRPRRQARPGRLVPRRPAEPRGIGRARIGWPPRPRPDAPGSRRGAGGWSARPGRAPSGVVGADPEQVEAGLLADLVQDPTEIPQGEMFPQGVRPDRAVRRPIILRPAGLGGPVPHLVARHPRLVAPRPAPPLGHRCPQDEGLVIRFVRHGSVLPT